MGILLISAMWTTPSFWVVLLVLNVVKKTTSASMKTQILQFLQRIDKCFIRGEYKTRVLKNFVSSVLRFHLAIEWLTVSSITSTRAVINSVGSNLCNALRNIITFVVTK